VGVGFARCPFTSWPVEKSIVPILMDTIRSGLNGPTGSTGESRYIKTDFKYFDKDEKKLNANES